MRPLFLQQLSAQLALVAIVPILLVSAVISGPLIWAQRDQQLAQAQLRLLQAGRTVNTLYTERLAFASLLVDLLADRPVLLASLNVPNRSNLQEFVRQTRGDTLFDLVTIVDPQGRVLAQDGTQALWQPQPRFDSTPTFRGLPGVGLVVQVAQPILGVDGELGTLVGTYVLDTAFLAELRASTDLDQGLLFGTTLVASSLGARMEGGGGSLQPELVDELVLTRGEPINIAVQVDGQPFLARYKPLFGYDGQVIGMIEVLLPLTPVHVAQNRATFVLLATTLVATLAAIMLAWILARRFTRPIDRLAQAATTMADDGLARPVPVAGPAEVRLLGQAIEQMRQRLYTAQAELAAEKARYANIIEAVEEAIITLDPDECVTSLNHAAETLLGIGRAAAHGRPLADIVHLDAEEQLTLAHIPLTGTVRLAIRSADGLPLTVAANRAQLAAGTAPEEHVLVLHDVSEETAVGQLRDEFLANITHEFRTPLAALTASLEILHDEEATLTAAERRQMLGAIHIGAQRLDTLVRNLLDSASLQAGYFRVHPVLGALEPLIEEAITTIRPLAQQRGQTIQVFLPPELPPLQVDDRRVVQVLVNLLSNASKFGPPGDTLIIDVTVAADTIVVGITDHGPGIAPTRRDRLFERFLRPGQETTQAQGAGLGLAIVKAIVERHGGTIAVDSSSNRGTTFRFTLPRVTDETQVLYEDSTGGRRHGFG